MADLESVNCKKFFCVFLVLSLHRHTAFTASLTSSRVFQTVVALSFPSLQEKSCMSAPCTHFHSPPLVFSIFPTDFIYFSIRSSLFRIVSANLSAPLFLSPNLHFCSSCPSSCFLVELLEEKQKCNLNISSL